MYSETILIEPILSGSTRHSALVRIGMLINNADSSDFVGALLVNC